MSRLIVLLLVTLIVGCGGSGESDGTTPASTTPASGTPSTRPTDSSGGTNDPRNADEALARLPSFDVPASPGVTEYREARVRLLFDLCVNNKYGVDKASYVRENGELLDSVPVFSEATLEYEISEGEPEPGYCLEGLGPVLSYETHRRFRLPPSVQTSELEAFYERELAGWTQEIRATPPCDREYSRGDASLTVDVCESGVLKLTADHAGRAEKRIPPLPKLPPRPTGAQYPLREEDPAQAQRDPTVYSVEPGSTCKRSIASGREGPVTLINPPSPGIRATLVNKPLVTSDRRYDQFVRVQWRFAKVLGDCPAVKLRLTIVTSQPTRLVYSLPFEIRSRSGTMRLPLLDFFRGVRVLSASAESFDGGMSRRVEVLIRR